MGIWPSGEDNKEKDNNRKKVSVAFDLKSEWARRPWWLNLMLLFSLYMTFIYSPFDVVLKPLVEDEDVWFGHVFHGTAAKIGGVVHWVVYAALAWGIWKMRPWTWLLGSLYATQVAIAMLAWPILQNQPNGLIVGAIAGALFALPAIAFWRSSDLFRANPSA